MSNYENWKHEKMEELRSNSGFSATDVVFLSWALEHLEEIGDFEDPQMVNMGVKKFSSANAKIDGYCIDDSDNSLILFVSDFEDRLDREPLNFEETMKLRNYMYCFLQGCCNGIGLKKYFDESNDIIKIGNLINSFINGSNKEHGEAARIKFYILSNRELSTRYEDNLSRRIKDREGFLGKPIEVNIWPFNRFFETEDRAHEPILIDFKNDFNCNGIPCLKADIGDVKYDAYVGIIPGKLLSDIYGEYSNKVLEGNVRAFLGTKGAKSINSGIRRTINDAEERFYFFSYNNGISVTAQNVETTFIDNQLYITKVKDFQIINGGQTTATLEEVSRSSKDVNKNLDGIFVPVKLTVIQDRETENEDGERLYDAKIQLIAEYANKQNKVTSADLASNSSFNRWMEKESERILAPAVSAGIPTRWYYERSRKKYERELSKLSGTNLSNFKTKCPKDQIIKKEELAKYYWAIFQKPDLVAKGNNKAYVAFNKEINDKWNNNKDYFDDYFFKKCIGGAILFRTINNYLEDNKSTVKNGKNFWYKAGGFKQDIIPYTIAKILYTVNKNGPVDEKEASEKDSCLYVNWLKIWKEQKVSYAFLEEIKKVTFLVNEFITTQNTVENVTEFCKKPSTWETFKKIEYTPSKDFMAELVKYTDLEPVLNESKKNQIDISDINLAYMVINFKAANWHRLLVLAEEKGLLEGSDSYWLNEAEKLARTVNLPRGRGKMLPKQFVENIKNMLAVREKLESFGIRVNA